MRQGIHLTGSEQTPAQAQRSPRDTNTAGTALDTRPAPATSLTIGSPDKAADEIAPEGATTIERPPVKVDTAGETAKGGATIESARPAVDYTNPWMALAKTATSNRDVIIMTVAVCAGLVVPHLTSTVSIKAPAETM